MPSQESREAIRAGRRDVKAKFVASPKQPASPLEDVKTQEAIIAPAPLVGKIGGEPIMIHELSARYNRGLTGLMYTIITDLAFDAKRINGALFSARLAGLVAEKYSDRILPFIARATKLPGEVLELHVGRDCPGCVQDIVERIDQDMTYEELVVVMVLLLNANNTLEALTPKAAAKNA